MEGGGVRRNLFTYSRNEASRHLFAYSHLAYSHSVYFRPKNKVLPTVKNDMKYSEPEWANQKPIRTYQVSYLENVGQYPLGKCT